MIRRSITLALLLTLTPFAGAQERTAPGDIPAFVDGRTPIVLTDTERAFIRNEMRGFLAGIQEILEASANGDGKRAAAAGRSIGMNGPEKDHIPKSLAPKLPMEFKQLGLATHRGFDQIADAAERDGGANAPKQLGLLMQNCVACHGTWRIAGEGGK